MTPRDRRHLSRLAQTVFVLCLLQCGIVSAPAETESDSDWQVRVWRKPVLGVNMEIKGLTQTSDGFLWLATRSQLVRFDGVDFEGFRAEDLAGTNASLNCLLKGRNDAVWLANTQGLITCIGPGRMRAFRDPDLATPRCLVEDGEGALWISSATGAVFRLKDGAFTRFDQPEGLPGRFGPHLIVDRSGALWFCVSSKIGRFRNGRFETLLKLGSNVRLLIAASAHGGIWIGKNNELIRYSEGGTPESRGTFSTASVTPSAILEDGDGSVWIGTQNDGLFHFDGHDFANVPTSHSTISCLFQDREDNLWVGTPEGLDQVRRRAIAIEGSAATPPSRAVGSLCETTDGTLWAVTKDGRLVQRAGSDWKPFENPGSVPLTGVTHIAAESSGALWIGTRSSELRRWQNGALTVWDTNYFSSRHISTLFVTRRGEVWAAGQQPSTLIHVTDEKLETIDLPPRTGFIRVMAEDAQGGVWIGGDRATLLRVSNGTLTNLAHVFPAKNPFVRCLYTTPDGSLWIATADSGVARYKDGQFSLITAEEGLFNSDVRQIIADDRGWLWFGSTRGIFKVRLDELNAFGDHRATRVHSVHYGREDDLPELEASVEDGGSAVRTRDGRLWIPMGMTLAIIDPAKLRDDVPPPPVLVKSVVADGNVLAAYGGLIAPKGGVAVIHDGLRLRLPADHRHLQFNFTGLSYQAPGNVNFRYLLEGFDREWTEGGARRDAVYPRLTAGDYRFRVQARNSDGLWNESGAAVAFSVLPFFWQTWWFETLAVAAFAGALGGVIRLVSFRRLQSRVRELERQTAIERERSRIARDLHDDLGASLTQIALLGDLARKDMPVPVKVGEHVQKISTTARHVMKSLDEIVWAVNPRNDTLSHLIDYIGQFALDYLRPPGIRCRLDLPEDPPERAISSDVRHNLFLVIKEALNNVVKHAQASEVWLRIDIANGNLRVAIEDNGLGFDRPPKDAFADGLRNMQNRLADIGGECRIESRGGGGTKITLEVPWQRN
jgi:signal transduction histidine kinase/ligand-binding sensor domain-containing protein